MLKNFTRIEVDDDFRQRLLAHWAALNTSRTNCMTCGQVPPWFYYDPTTKHYAGVCNSCRQSCEHVPITGYIITRSGSYQVKRVCIQCGAGPSTVGSAKRGSEYLDICLDDHRDDTSCERCESVDGVELHHYAPRNVFPDADRWATGYLCRPCHREWHRTMNGYLWTAKRTAVA